MSETYNDPIAATAENPLYIDGDEVLIDGYDYKEIKEKHVDFEVSELTNLTSLPYPNSGEKSAVGIVQGGVPYIYAQIKTGSNNILPYGLSSATSDANEFGDLNVGDSFVIGGWDYDYDNWSYHCSTSTGHEFDHDGIVIDYEPDEYDPSILIVGNKYYDMDITTYWQCTASSSGSFSMKKLVMPAVPTPSRGEKLYKYNCNTNTWTDTNIETNNARNFYVYDGYIYYYEKNNNVYTLKKTDGLSSPTTVINDAKYGDLGIFNNKLCVLPYNEHKIYSINGSSYTLESTTPVSGTILTNSEGSFIFSGGSGIYKFKNSEWELLDYLDTSFVNCQYYVINDIIYIIYSGAISFYTEQASINWLYDIPNHPSNVSAIVPINNLTNKIYTIGVSSSSGEEYDRETLQGISSSIEGILIDSRYLKIGRKTIDIKSVIVNTTWESVISPDFGSTNVVKFLSCGDYLYAFNEYGLGKKYNGGSDWVDIQSAPYYLYSEPSMVVAQDKIWLFGSGKKANGNIDSEKNKMIYCYDPKTDTWSRLKKNGSVTKNLNSAYSICSSLVYYVESVKEFWFFGGYVGKSSGRKRFIKFNINTQKWTKVLDLPFEVLKGNVFTLKNNIYVFIRVGKPNTNVEYDNRIYEIYPSTKFSERPAWFRNIDPGGRPTFRDNTLISDYDTVYQINMVDNYMYSRKTLPSYNNGTYNWDSVGPVPISGDTEVLTTYHKGILYVMEVHGANQGTYRQTGSRLYTISIKEEV